MFSGIRSKIARWIAPATTRKVRAGYDAAQSGIDDDHWAWADSLNANALNSPEVRKTLREKARYEEQNNCYCGNLIDKLSKDMVGTSPRLQLTIPGATADAIRVIERRFKQWANSINLGEKLRLLDMAAIRDGEGFAVLSRNPELVLPTHVGVNRIGALHGQGLERAPHACGGEPGSRSPDRPRLRCSPRMWG